MKIDLAEKFDQLARPPIVEAVVQINGQVQRPWEEEALVREVTREFPEFTQRQALTAFAMTFNFPVGPKPPEAQSGGGLETGFNGLRLTTADGKWIAQITRDFVALSRLAPFERWEEFRDRAMRLWEFHAAVGGVEQVVRVASRFINRVDVPVDGLDVGAYFRGFAPAPGEFGVAGFLHQTLLCAPSLPYFVTVIRTHQPSAEGATTLPLILDLEAFCSEPSSAQASIIQERLADLRWIKNKVFFATVTEKLLSMCR